jgi:phosphonate transport system substrate-binding protein
MEKRSRRVSLAFLVASLLFIPEGQTGAQVKQPAGVKTLVLGVIFQENPDAVAKHFRPLVEYVGRKLAAAGEIKSAVIVAPNAAQLTSLLDQKRVDFYLESAFPTYLINRSGTAKLLLRRWKSGMSDYRGVIFTSRESGITRLEDLRGKMIAFEDAGSTSGYFLPKLLLFEKGFALIEKPALDAKLSAREVGYVFGGTEKNVVRLVLQKKVAAGAISDDDYASLEEPSRAGLLSLIETGALPRHLVSVRRSLPEGVIQRLKDILLAMDGDDEGLKILQQTDNTRKFDTLPGGEEEFRRRLIQLYRPRAGR